ncbi:leucine-rich repeat-domain-containing protein [Globomyces pollinis-pini]|nr:leucine-rich repeat-domain-containing protein [Globomyces pollinis-pini]
MSKLDYDLITSAYIHINPINERELDLRGKKIQKIENLTLTKDQNDAIDLTDNDILKLANFPIMVNLKTILCANNRITKIEPTISQYLPNLKVLILNNNVIQELGDLDPLTGFEFLETLSLIDNIVCSKDYYRLYVIHRCPKLRVLDFKKVKESERKEALELFSGEEGTKLVNSLSAQGMNGNTFDPDTDLKLGLKKVSSIYKAPSKEHQDKIREAIKNAKSLQEIQRLEQSLSSGIIPEA